MSETADKAGGLVLYGITGDLAKKSLLPALYRMAAQGDLDVPVVGVTRGDWTDERLREHARQAVEASGDVDEESFGRFADLLRITSVDYDDPSTYDRIAERADGAERLVHYLAIPPSDFAKIAKGLSEAGLAEDARFVVEKPFGNDLASARALQKELTRYFPEERLRRVDHFLGKDAVEDLLVLRSANRLLDAVLDREHVRSVQITMAEDLDVADRGAFYDGVGAVRDVVQNHVLQTLAYLIMECPSGSEELLDAKARALRSVRAVDPADFVRGQYDGYRDTDGVDADSRTETYVALRTYVDSERWKDVPFTIRAGKCMPAKSFEIIVELHPARDGLPPNLVRFRLDPEPAVTFDLLAENPEPDASGVDPASAHLTLSRLSGDHVSAYVRVLTAALTGDPTRFARMDQVEECWRIVEPLLDPASALASYKPGTWGPAEADPLTSAGGWHSLDLAR